MNKIYNLLIALSVMTVTVSCDDFLTRSAQDLIIPQNVEHYKELLQGDGYFKTLLQKSYWTHFMTDDIEFGNDNALYPTLAYTDNHISTLKGVYLWQKEIENDAFSDELYSYCYSQILVANTCLDGLKDAEGSDADKELVEGQAKFHRAMSYFYLANLYAEPYNKAQETDLCVPLKTDPTPSLDAVPRATIKQIWDQIVLDCNDAMKLLKGKKISGYYEINYNAALLLSARVALFMENYDDAIKYASELLNNKNTLQDITSQTKATASRTGAGDASVINFLNSENNPENLWAFNETGISDNIYTYTRFLGTARIGFYLRISSSQENNLMSMYDFDSNTKTGDRRALYWFSYTTKGIVVISPFNYYSSLKYDKTDKSSPYLYQQMFRVGEAYLILAESYARKQSPDVTQALSYLNGLRSKRINPYTELTASDFAINEDLVKFIWDERRRELCFEECFRWWDLRRTGQPALKHAFSEGSSNQVYSLKENDPAYVLNFPIAEREYYTLSGALVPNSRPDRNPE